MNWLSLYPNLWGYFMDWVLRVCEKVITSGIMAHSLCNVEVRTRQRKWFQKQWERRFEMDC